MKKYRIIYFLAQKFKGIFFLIYFYFFIKNFLNANRKIIE